MDSQISSGGRAPLIQEEAGKLAFGRPILMNTFRAVVAEAIVAQGLGARWHHCAADYHPFDFQRDDGVALEVKQSAARQSWAKDGDKPSKCVFDIAEREGRYVEDIWVKERRRWADIYILAHHPRTDVLADHRDPDQWAFYVALTRDLPTQATLRLSRAVTLSRQASFVTLARIVDDAASQLRP